MRAWSPPSQSSLMGQMWGNGVGGFAFDDLRLLPLGRFNAETNAVGQPNCARSTCALIVHLHGDVQNVIGLDRVDADHLIYGDGTREASEVGTTSPCVPIALP